MVQAIDKFPHEFLREYLELISQYIPGDMTLNQIRVLQYVAMRSDSDEGSACNTEISDALGMSAATVTRAISFGIKAGIVSEEEDPEDGRRRFVMMSDSYPKRGSLDRNVIELARGYFPRRA